MSRVEEIDHVEMTSGEAKEEATHLNGSGAMMGGAAAFCALSRSRNRQEILFPFQHKKVCGCVLSALLSLPVLACRGRVIALRAIASPGLVVWIMLIARALSRQGGEASFANFSHRQKGCTNHLFFSCHKKESVEKTSALSLRHFPPEMCVV